MKALYIYKKIMNGIFMISCAVIFIVMVYMFADVVKQVFTGVGFLGSFELVEVGLVCIVYFAFCYTQTKGKHIVVDLVLNNLPKRVQQVLQIVTGLLTLVFGYIIIRASWINIQDVMRDGLETATLGIPLWPFYAVCFIGSILLTIAFLATLVENCIIIFAKNGEELIKEYRSSGNDDINC